MINSSRPGFMRLANVLLFSFIITSFYFTSSAQGYRISTFAGGGASLAGNGAPATNAELRTPSGVCLDQYGNVYFSDQNFSNVRKVDSLGIITTVAGLYTVTASGDTTAAPGGYNGDSIPATSATLYWPEGVIVDRHGNLYIADQFNNRIRKVTTDGYIHTICGGSSPGDSGDGGPATAALIRHPNDVSVDYAGNVYFADMNNHKVKKIDTTGLLTTIAGTGAFGFSGDGGPATAAELYNPDGLESDSMGNVFIADLYNNRIRRVDATTGIITTILGVGTGACSGDGGSATSASIWEPTCIGVDKVGDIYIGAGSCYRVKKIDTAGILTNVAGNGIDGYNDGCGGPSELDIPQGVRPDNAGCVYIADYENNRLRKACSCDMSVPTIDSLNDSTLSTTIVYTGYQWLKSGVPIPGATNATYIVRDTGYYSVFATDSTCCTGESAVHFAIPAPAGISNISNQYVVSVKPNPTTGIINISGAGLVDVIITNAIGGVLKEAENTNEISITELPAGLYLIRIKNNRGEPIYFEKIIKL